MVRKRPGLFFFPLTSSHRRQNSVVSIGTGYRLEDWEVGVRDPVASRIVTPPYRPDRLWGPHNLIYNVYRGIFSGCKAAGAWIWPLTTNDCRGQENVDLQAGRSPVQVPDEVDFFNSPNLSSRTMALGSTQPLTKMSTRNLPGGKNAAGA
jgi:hypothetical protein